MPIPLFYFSDKDNSHCRYAVFIVQNNVLNVTVAVLYERQKALLRFRSCFFKLNAAETESDFSDRRTVTPKLVDIQLFPATLESFVFDAFQIAAIGKRAKADIRNALCNRYVCQSAAIGKGSCSNA